MKLFIIFYWVMIVNNQPVSNCNYQIINNIVIVE